MTPTQLRDECDRIAAIINRQDAYVTVHVMSSIKSFSAISVTVAGKSIYGTTWQQLFADAEAYARSLVQKRDAGEIEYESWAALPPLAIAADATAECVNRTVIACSTTCSARFPTTKC